MISEEEFSVMCNRIAANMERGSIALRDELNRVCAKPHKYHAQQTEVDGIKFASGAEAKAYQDLKMLQEAGFVFGLKLQPRFLLQEGFRDQAGKWHRPIYYVGDFEFTRMSGGRTVVDVKGVETPVFKLKESLFRAKYPYIALEIWGRKGRRNG